MSKSVTIPMDYDPWICEINGKVYSYKAGTTQTVPDEVAELIGIINASKPVEAPEAGTQGQVWTKQAHGAAWGDLPISSPVVIEFTATVTEDEEEEGTFVTTVHTCNKTHAEILAMVNANAQFYVSVEYTAYNKQGKFAGFCMAKLHPSTDKIVDFIFSSDEFMRINSSNRLFGYIGYN